MWPVNDLTKGENPEVKKDKMAPFGILCILSAFIILDNLTILGIFGVLSTLFTLGPLMWPKSLLTSDDSKKVDIHLCAIDALVS